MTRCVLLCTLVILCITLAGCGSGSLPKEAKEALDKDFSEGWGCRGTAPGVASARRAEIPSQGPYSGTEELWCVAMDRANCYGYSHFLVGRRGLLWLTFLEDGPGGQSKFLSLSCDNW